MTFIDTSAFEGCSGLVSVAFCEEMEQLVNEVTFSWWNYGKSKESLRIYSLLAQHNILGWLGTMKIQAWKSNIHKMLQQILVGGDFMNKKTCVLVASWLSEYECLQDNIAPILELALWKSKMEEQCNNFPIIIPNALSFL